MGGEEREEEEKPLRLPDNLASYETRLRKTEAEKEGNVGRGDERVEFCSPPGSSVTGVVRKEAKMAKKKKKKEHTETKMFCTNEHAWTHRRGRKLALLHQHHSHRQRGGRFFASADVGLLTFSLNAIWLPFAVLVARGGRLEPAIKEPAERQTQLA